MDKNDWELAVERIKVVLANAQDNKDKAEKDIEEIEFMLSHYADKIAEFKDA